MLSLFSETYFRTSMLNPHVHIAVFPFRVLLGRRAKERRGCSLDHPMKVDGKTQTNLESLAYLC